MAAKQTAAIKRKETTRDFRDYYHAKYTALAKAFDMTFPVVCRVVVDYVDQATGERSERRGAH